MARLTSSLSSLLTAFAIVLVSVGLATMARTAHADLNPTAGPLFGQCLNCFLGSKCSSGSYPFCSEANCTDTNFQFCTPANCGCIDIDSAQRCECDPTKP